MNELGGYEFEDLHPGMSATYAKTITEAVQLYKQGQMERVTAEELLAEYGEG